MNAVTFPTVLTLGPSLSTSATGSPAGGTIVGVGSVYPSAAFTAPGTGAGALNVGAATSGLSVLTVSGNAATALPQPIAGSVAQFAAADAVTTNVVLAGFGASPGASLRAYGASGTGASPAATAAGVNMSNIVLGGYDGTNWASGLTISNIAAPSGSAWTTGDHGSKVNFNLPKQGTTTSTTIAEFDGVNSLISLGGAQGSEHLQVPIYLASIVNCLRITGGTAGNPVTVASEANGVDAGVNIALTPFGTGTTTVTQGGLSVTGIVAPSVGLTLGSHTATATNGTLWNDSTQNSLGYYESGMVTYQSALSCSAAATATTSGTGASSLLSGTVIGALTLPANFLVVGKVLRVTAVGTVTTSAAPGTTTVICALGGTTVATSAAVTLAVSQTGTYFEIQILMTCQTAGSSGKVYANGRLIVATSTITVEDVVGVTSSASTTINTTTPQAITLTSTNSAGGGAVFTVSTAIIEVLS